MITAILIPFCIACLLNLSNKYQIILLCYLVDNDVIIK